MKINKNIYPALCAGVLGLCGAALAQTAVSIDSARIEGQLKQPTPLQNTPSGAKSKIPQAQLKSLPGAENTVFTLKNLKIIGAQHYPEDQLAVYYSALIGTEISIAKLYEVTRDMTQHYYNDGNIFSRVIIPPQSIENGTITLQVIEGFIADITTISAPADTFSIVKKITQNLKSGEILNIKSLEKSLLLLNDLPGLSVKSVLEPADNRQFPAGALNLKLTFKETSQKPSLSFDNYGSRFIGPYQIGGKLSLENTFDHMAKTTVQAFQTTEFKELNYIFLSHDIPIHESGTVLGLSGNYSRVIPGFTLEANNLKSYSKQAAIEIRQPIIRSRRKNLTTSLRLENQRSDTKVLETRLFKDRLTVVELGMNFDFHDKWKGVNLLNLKARKGLDILGARETGSVDLSREEGRSDFTLIRGSLARLQSISNKWSFFGLIKGQFASAPLLSSEEFGYGGNEIGFAYNASEIVGDHGLAALGELRYNAYNKNGLLLVPYAFYDIGKTWNIDRIDSTNFSGSSAGLGMRAYTDSGISLDFTLGYPLTRDVATPQWGSGSGIQAKIAVGYELQ